MFVMRFRLLALVTLIRPTSVATRETLENERKRFSQSHSASSSEADALKVRITDLEREKRDLVGVIARLRTEDEEREGESLLLASSTL